MGWIEGDTVAGVHAGALDVLHDARDQHVVAVADGVHLDLRAFQVLVNQQRLLARDLLGHGGETQELVGRSADLHGAAAQHKRGPDEHRIAELARELDGFFGRRHDSTGWLGNGEVVKQIAELIAVFGEVDRAQV